MFWSFALWISIALTVQIVALWYIGTRLITTSQLPGRWRTLAWGGLIAVWLIPFATMWLFRYLDGLWNGWSWITYTILGFLSLVFTALVIRDLAILGWTGITWFASFVRQAETDPTDSSRRQFLLQVTNLGVLGAASVATAYGVYQARRRPGIINLRIPIKNLPAAFEGFRIVQFTDIHAGLTVKRDWVETIAQEVADLKPDLIAFTGDLADGSVSNLRNDVAPLSELRAPYGKFFVTGNHEYYSGAEQWVEETGRMGYRVLMNEHELISKNGSSIVLAGVTDYSAGGFIPAHKSDPVKAVNGAPPERVKILMAHQPRSLYAAESLGFDLILNGHTHGGQFFPWNLVAAIGQPYIKGLHNHNGSWVYVSKGTGYWGPPVRLGARSEITVFTLTASENNRQRT